MKIALPNDRKLKIISKFMYFGTRYAVVITSINENQEKSLDNGESIELNEKFIVNPKDVYCYGEIDFSNDDDINTINNFDWICDPVKGESIPAHYNYETHTCESINLHIGEHETFDNVKIAMYGHGCIGKPKRCLIFKCKFDDVKRIFD